MPEDVLLLLQGLQDTPVPVILIGGGLAMLIVGVVGSLRRQEITRGRRRWAKIIGMLFLLLGVFLSVGSRILPLIFCPHIQKFDPYFISLLLVLTAEVVQKTPIPSLITGSSVLLIFVSIVGFFGEVLILRGRQRGAACAGVFFLLLGIFLADAQPFLLLLHAPTTAGLEEILDVPFTQGKEAISTCRSYEGATTLRIEGEASVPGKVFADALYIYGKSGPTHRADFTLWMNGKPIDAYARIGSSCKDHTYTLSIHPPAGPLTFRVGKGLSIDRSGYFVVVLRSTDGVAASTAFGSDAVPISRAGGCASTGA